MHSFNDKNGKSWSIELTVGSMERVKDQLEINLFDPVAEDEQLITNLAPIGIENIILFVNTLYVLCSTQCEDEGISSTQFGELLGGNALNEAYSAFYSEWEDFFSQLGRTDRVEIIRKMTSTILKSVENVTKRIEEVNLDQIIDSAMS